MVQFGINQMVHMQEGQEGGASGARANVLPERLGEMVRGYMPSRCLLTALELDIFSAVGDGATAAEVAKAVAASERGVEMLLNSLAALDLVRKDGPIFRNTPEAARFFQRGAEDSHRDGLLHIANIWHRWSMLTEAVRQGTRVPVDQRMEPNWTENFITGMQLNAQSRAGAVLKAVGTEGVRKVLDLGGGSGIYSITFAKASPEVRAEIVDLPGVVPLTKGYVERAGAAGQVSVRAGNMLEDDLGAGYDVAMLNQICHMFSEDENRRLFRRIRRALAPGGRLVVQEFLLEPDKAGPLHAALFSLNMLVSTDAGSSYTEAELAEWMKTAGFSEVRRIDLPGPSDLVVGRV